MEKNKLVENLVEYFLTFVEEEVILEARKKYWIKGAIKRPGAFKAKAKAAGMSTAGYAQKVLAKGSQASTRTKRQAVLAQRLKKMPKHHGPRK